MTAAQLNQLPTATADIGSVDENASLVVTGRMNGVLGNDADPDTGETVLLRVARFARFGAFRDHRRDQRDDCDRRHLRHPAD